MARGAAQAGPTGKTERLAMTIAWFLCSYKRKTGNRIFPTRVCAMNDFTPDIISEGGAWSETEVLGDQALVKVRASDTLLTTIADAGHLNLTKFLAKMNLADSLSDLTNANRNVIENRLRQNGYTQSEIDAALGSNLTAWRARTFGDLLNLIAAKRLEPRYDSANDLIICDGTARACKPVSKVDKEVV